MWLFRKYSENGTMDHDQLHRFLIEFQKERQATQDDAQAIFNSLKHLKMFQRRGLRLEGFFRYLLSDLNLALSPAQVHHDMDAPLAHYFLYTGHNSYLTGNQLSSDSSIEPIIKALVRGVRVIELDLWPNSSGNSVDVCHGGTLTKPVELIECFRAIKEYAFSASEFPLVLTFEDHLTPYLQARVAEMVSKTFGELLFYPESDYLKEFPSPKSLKNKIIISTKPPKEYLESESITIEEEPLEQEAISANKEVTDNKAHKQEEQVEGDADEDALKASPDEYRRLIAIHAGKPKGGIKQWLRIDFDKVRRLSLSEQELENVVESFPTDTVR